MSRSNTTIPNQSKNLVKATGSVTQRRGPIPDAEELAKYNQINDTFANRILEMAELEQVHQHTLNNNEFKLKSTAILTKVEESKLLTVSEIRFKSSGQLFSFLGLYLFEPILSIVTGYLAFENDVHYLFAGLSVTTILLFAKHLYQAIDDSKDSKEI